MQVLGGITSAAKSVGDGIGSVGKGIGKATGAVRKGIEGPADAAEEPEAVTAHAKKEEPAEPEISKMKGGDYRIQVHIMEAKDIIPKGGLGMAMFSNKEGSADPLMQVTILEQTKCTKPAHQTLSPIFNETLYFIYTGLNAEELEMGEICFHLMDHNSLVKNTILGSFLVDLTHIYGLPDHEAYRKWIQLVDIDGADSQIKGYVKVTISILGPDDKPVSHKAGKNPKSEMKDNMLCPTTMGQTRNKIIFELYRGAYLAPLDLAKDTLDAYVKVMFAGNKVKSSVVTDRNPKWNESLEMSTNLPSMCKKMVVEVWDHETMMDDERVGSFNIRIDIKKMKYDKPIVKWHNIYGAPLGITGKYADYMTKYGAKGSFFRGRILYSLIIKPEENVKTRTKKIKYSFPLNPQPNPPERKYILRLELLEGHELPLREALKVHFSCGPFKIISDEVEMGEICFAKWYKRLEDLIIIGPECIDQVPDIFIYLATSDDPDDRICYCRIKASSLLNPKGDPSKMPTISLQSEIHPEEKLEPRENKLQKLELQEDKSFDKLDEEEFSGFLWVRMELLWKHPEPRIEEIDIPEPIRNKYLIRIELYQGRNLPAADETCSSDPFLVFRCAGNSVKSTVKYLTLNPSWFETLELEVEIPDPTQHNDDTVQYSLSGLVYEEDPDRNELLGLIHIPLTGIGNHTYTDEQNEKYEILMYSPPAPYKVYFPGESKGEGEIFVSFHMFDIQLRDKIPKRNIKPDSLEGHVNMGCLGLRNAIHSLNLFPLRSISFMYDVEGHSSNPIKTKRKPINEHSCNILENTKIQFQIPLEPDFSPILSIYCYDNHLGPFGKRCIGTANLPLAGAVKALMMKESKRVARLKMGKELEITESEGSRDLYLEDTHRDNENVNDENMAPSEVKLMMHEENKEEEVQSSESKSEISEYNDDREIINIDGHVITRQKRHPGKFYFATRGLQKIKLQLRTNYEINEQKNKFAVDADGPIEKCAGAPLPPRPRNQESVAMSESNKAKELLTTFLSNYIENSDAPLPGAGKGNEQTEEEKERDEKAREMQKEKIANVIAGKLGKKHLKLGKKVKGGIKSEREPLLGEEEKEGQKGDLLEGSMSKREHGQIVAHMEGEADVESLALPGQEVEDTVIGEEYDKIPEWKVNRPEIDHRWTPDKFPYYSLDIQRGQTRGTASFFSNKLEKGLKEVGKFKSFIKLSAKGGKQEEAKSRRMLKALREKKVIIRVYILEARALTPKDSDGLSDPYLIVSLGKQVKEDDESHRENTNNPEFYRYFQFMTTFPGVGTLHIDVRDDDGFMGSDSIGSAIVDLENRWFSKQWHAMPKKPIETLILMDPTSAVPQGSITLWIDMMTVKEAKKDIIYDITPPPKIEFEVRVIIWGTQDVAIKDIVEKCNDLYVKGTLGKEERETDTHWRCRKKGSFNYRWKFPLTLPLRADNDEDYGKDILVLSMWDRDILKSNEMICQSSISLKTHKMLKKAYFRKAKVLMKKLNPKGEASDRFWLTCFHPNAKDENGEPKPQGKVEISISVMPMTMAKKLKNGEGREAPNRYPHLDKPTGRFKFDLFHPWDTFKELIGPDNARKLCCCLCCICWCVIIFYILIFVVMII